MRDWGAHSPGILFLIMVNKSPVTIAIIRLKPLGAALQQNSEEKDRRENVALPLSHPSLSLFLPETERKQVYWQAGLGAADNNVGFVPR